MMLDYRKLMNRMASSFNLILLVLIVFSCNVVVISNLFAGEVKHLKKVYVDEEKNKGVDYILSNASLFHQYDERVLNYGYSNAAIWVAVEMADKTPLDDLVLEINYPLIDNVEFYTVYSHNRLIKKQSGDLFPMTLYERDINSRNSVFFLGKSAGAEKYLIRIVSEGQVVVPIEISTLKEFIANDNGTHFIQGSYIGVIFIIAIMSLFIYIALYRSEKYYIYYSVYLLCYGALMFVFNGFYYELFNGESMVNNNLLLAFLICLTQVTAIQFSIEFIRPNNKSSGFQNVVMTVLKLFVYASILVAILTMLEIAIGNHFVPYGTIIKALTASLIVAFLLIISMVAATENKRLYDYIFGFAWIFLSIGIIISSFRAAGFVKHNFITLYGKQILSVLEVAFFTLAVSYRIRDAKMQERCIPSKLRSKEARDSIFKQENKNVTILFADLENSVNVSIAVDVTAADVIKFTNKYIDTMYNIIDKNNGVVDKFTGDGIMATFGAATMMTEKDQAVNSIRAAIQMQSAMKNLIKGNVAQFQSIKQRIGLAMGTVTAGMFGNNHLESFTVIGPAVNIASRLEGKCPPEMVLAHYSIYNQINTKDLGEGVTIRNVPSDTIPDTQPPDHVYACVLDTKEDKWLDPDHFSLNK